MDHPELDTGSELVLISGYSKHFYFLPNLLGAFGHQMIKRCGPSLPYSGPIGSIDHPMFIFPVLNGIIAIAIFKKLQNILLAPDQ